MFEFAAYSTNLQEYNALTMTSPVSPGQIVATIHAIDRDGTSTAAGRLEYRITNGAMQFNQEMFRIDRNVRLAVELQGVPPSHPQFCYSCNHMLKRYFNPLSLPLFMVSRLC
jgi:hypothetical protein